VLLSLFMDLRTLQARWILEEIAPDELHVAATELLVQGIESPALVELAGLYGASYWSAAPVVARTFAEAGLRPISREAALWRLAYWTASRVVAGATSPLEGAGTLWRICNDLDMPESLRYFVYLAADYGEGPKDRRTEEAWFDARIVETARELLASMPGDGESPPLDAA
jgi:hypothetical protein